MKLTNLQNDIEVYESLKEAEKSTVSIVPPGYTTIQLSTGGKLGAPALFHVRNFKVKEILALSITNDIDLPSRLISILNDMILEDVDVGSWHEKEIEELMVYIFYTFYKNTLVDVAFPIEASDLEYLRGLPNGEEKIEDLKAHRWIPRVNIEITRDVSTYDLPDNFSAETTILNKKSGFFLTFSYIRYRDQLIVRRWIDSYFREEDYKFKKIESQLKFNKNILEVSKNNPDIIDSLIHITPEDEEAYKEYINRRIQTTAEVVRLVSIINYNGQDVSNLSIGDKYELMSKDARIDYGLISKLEKKQEKNKFGINPMVDMINPITGEPCKRRFSFRISSILQALQLSGDNDDDDNYVIEN